MPSSSGSAISSGPARYPGHDAPPGALVDIAQFIAEIAANVRPIRTTRCALADAAGLVLADAVVLDADYPPFDKSMMDGFALRAADVAAAPVDLRLVHEIAAGDRREPTLLTGQAMRINTGAPLPPGADAVVIVERCQVSADGAHVRVLESVRPGAHIVPAAAVRARGQVVLHPAQRLGAAQLAAAAAAGCGEVTVYERPTLSIVVTGSELVPAGRGRAHGQICDSNGPMLECQGRDAGAEVRWLGICPDDPAVLRQFFGRALESTVVVTVGGMAMGSRDLAPTIMEELNVEWNIHGVNLRPGRPIGYGIGPAGQHVFGLPGNPVSSFIGMHLFVRAAVEGLSGLPVRLPRGFRARLGRDLPASRDPRPAYLPATLLRGPEGSPVVESVAWGGSGDPFGLAAANALLLQPEGGAAMPAGTPAEVTMIGPMR